MTAGSDTKLLSRLITFLDSFASIYNRYNVSQAEIKFHEYVRLARADEEQFIQPAFAPAFLETFLGFSIADYTPEFQKQDTRPDFVPNDRFGNPFLFETKGSNWRASRLTGYAPTLRKYALHYRADYVVIISPHLIQVVDSAGTLQSDVSVNVLELYEAAKGHRLITSREELTHFSAFVRKFTRASFEPSEKLHRLRSAKKWTGAEFLDIDDLVRAVSEIVSIITSDVDQRFSLAVNGLTSMQRTAIEAELEVLSLQVLALPRPLRLDDIIHVARDEPAGRLRTALIGRVAYLTVVRLLVLRSWEDGGLIKSSLYDGGLDQALRAASDLLPKTLETAYTRGRRIYRWLFETSGPYSWYVPDDVALIETLYQLAPFNLSKVNSDVLGRVYESLIDRTDRKNKGQYYTNRDVIRFIADVSGFIPSRRRRVLDMACGSGGFLVEIARRYLARGIDFDATVDAITGVEISDFAQFIAQANLLLLMMSARSRSELPRALPVVAGDSLRLLSADGVSSHSNDKALARSRASARYDLVITNPPYIGQKDHKDLFDRTIEASDLLRSYSESKMDYFYFFIAVGLDALRDGGKLAFITTDYWPTAHGASKLRRKILAEAVLECFVDFYETRLFRDAPGQHNCVFVLRRERDARKRGGNRPFVVRLKTPVQPDALPAVLKDLTRVTSSKREVDNEHMLARFSPYRQDELTAAPWNLFAVGAARVPRDGEETLASLCNLTQGVVPGPISIGANIRKLDGESLAALQIDKRSGVFVLTEAERRRLGTLSSHERSLIVPYFKNSDIRPTLLDGQRHKYWLLYIDWLEQAVHIPALLKFLQPYKPYLKSRREAAAGKMPWYALHWPRARDIFTGPKLLWAARSLDSGFALSTEPAYGGTDLYFATLKQDQVPIEFIFLYLNSSTFKAFLQEAGKRKGKMTENFVTHLKDVTVPIHWLPTPAVHAIVEIAKDASAKRDAAQLTQCLHAFDNTIAAGQLRYEPTFHRPSR